MRALVAQGEHLSIEEMTERIYGVGGSRGRRLIRAFEGPCWELLLDRNPGLTRGTPLELVPTPRARVQYRRGPSRGRVRSSRARAAARRGATRAGPAGTQSDSDDPPGDEPELCVVSGPRA